MSSDFDDTGQDALPSLDAARLLSDLSDNFDGPPDDLSALTILPEPGAKPQHDVKPHPLDPKDAIATAAAEVCDPELIRGRNAADLGKTLFAIDEEFLFGPVNRLVAKLEDGISGIRKGAVIAEAQRAVGERKAIVDTTEVESALEVDRGEAAATRADRLEQDLHREMRLIAEDEDALEDARETVEQRRAWRGALRDRLPSPGLTRLRSLFESVALDLRVALAIAVIDVVVTTLLLEPAMGDLIPIGLAGGSTLLAAGVAVSTLGAAAVAGFALAALGLSGRIVALIGLGALTAIALKLVPALDAARAGLDEGAQTLTAATLSACFVAAMTAYSAAVHKLYESDREAWMEAGGPLADANWLVRQAEDAYAELKQAIAVRQETCAALRSEIDALRTVREQTEGRVHEREAAGIVAQAELETISAASRTECVQEDRSAVAARSAVEMAYRKTRAERRPDPTAAAFEALLRDAGDPRPAARRSPFVSLASAAVVLLAIAAIAGGLFDMPVLLVVGGVVSGLLVLVGLLLERRRDTGGPAVETNGHGPDGPPIHPAADRGSPLWRRQPDRTVPKYGRGPIDPTQAQ